MTGKTSKDKTHELENDIDYLMRENERQATKLSLLKELANKLYISKLTLSSNLFERELKEFFKSTIDKRI